MGYPYKISAVICSYNRARFIIEAVESIFNQDFSKENFEVIVVDNNSTDGTLGRLADYKAAHPDYNFRYVTEPNQGVAYARTRCAKEAQGEIVAYLDDDSIAQPGWLSQIADFFDQHPEVYSTGGKITPYFLTGIPDWYSKYFFGLVGRFDQGDEVKQLKGQRYPCGANMAFRKKVFEEIGYFNASLGRSGKGLLATEEKEIYMRILKHGKQVFYLPGVEVLHAVESNKFDRDYVRRHSMGIGGGERLRLKGETAALAKKFIEYVLKWGYAVAYGIGFILRGQWSKFVMLERFRWWVIIGFLYPSRAK
ncbi:MAG: glycosyltransferase family 2 protein [Sphingobacteriales bacterium]|nr:MAG: glycosyltransferase family 2 protein [Sphingobacteriales bacterium]